MIFLSDYGCVLRFASGVDGDSRAVGDLLMLLSEFAEPCEP